MTILKFYLILFFIFDNCFWMHLKDVNAKSNLPRDELLRRQKLVDSYLADLSETQKDWLESNHLAYKSSSIPPLKVNYEKFSELYLKQSENLDLGAHEKGNSPLPSSKKEKETLDGAFTDNSRRAYLNSKFSKVKSKINKDEFEKRREVFISFYPRLNDLEKNDGIENDNDNKITQFNDENDVKEQEKLQKQKVSKEEIPDISGIVNGKNKFQTENNKETSEEFLNDNIKLSTFKQSLKNEDVCLHEKLNFHLTKTCDSKVMPLKSNTKKSLKKGKRVSAIHNFERFNVNTIKDVSENGPKSEIEISEDEIWLENEMSKMQNLMNSLSEIIGSRLKIQDFSQSKAPNNDKFIKIHGSESQATNNEILFNSELIKLQYLITTYFEMVRPVHIEKSSLLSSKEIKFNSESIENGKSDTSDIDSELIHRQNVFNSYMSKLRKNQENWVESYHFNYQVDSENQWLNRTEVSHSNNFVTVKKLQFSNYNAEYSQKNYAELYLTRWVNRLLNKYSDYSLNDQSSLSFSLSDNSLSKLKRFSSSKNFKISHLDELIRNLISNATLHNGYKLSYVMPSGFVALTVGGLLLSLAIIYSGHLVILFSRGFVIFPFIITLSFIINGFKLYQQKVAKKHAILSQINSSYCQSILTYESGILAHIKELFRHAWHDEDCKKYFEALMIDPISEISPTVIVTDLISSSFSHLIMPLGEAINIFYKNLIYDLGFFDKIYFLLIILVIFLCLLLIFPFRMKYKLNFPFFLGSLEPSTSHSGSRVEDVRLIDKKCSIENSTNAHALPPINVKTVVHLGEVLKDNYLHKENYGFKDKRKLNNSLTLEKYTVPKMPKVIHRRSSF